MKCGGLSRPSPPCTAVCCDLGRAVQAVPPLHSPIGRSIAPSRHAGLSNQQPTQHNSKATHAYSLVGSNTVYCTRAVKARPCHKAARSIPPSRNAVLSNQQHTQHNSNSNACYWPSRLKRCVLQQGCQCPRPVTNSNLEHWWRHQGMLTSETTYATQRQPKSAPQACFQPGQRLKHCALQQGCQGPSR